MKSHKLFYFIALLISIPICKAVAYDMGETCSHTFTYTADSAPMECDNCWGYGWLYWAISISQCSGQSSNYYNSCADRANSVPYTACSVEDGATKDIDIYLSTYGSVYDCSCHAGGTPYSAHWSVTVYDHRDTEITGSIEAEFILKQKASAVNINQTMVGDNVSWTKGGSSSLTLGGNASIEATLKDIFKVKLGFDIQGSWATTWSSTYTHLYQQDEVGLYGAPFYIQQRNRTPVRYRYWDTVNCNGPGSWTNTYIYQGFDASVAYYTASSPTNLANLEGNTGWLSSDSTALN